MILWPTLRLGYATISRAFPPAWLQPHIDSDGAAALHMLIVGGPGPALPSLQATVTHVHMVDRATKQSARSLADLCAHTGAVFIARALSGRHENERLP